MASTPITKKLKPVEDLSLVDRVELQLMELVAGDELQPGDKLPKEVELAAAFGVSRTVVREALTRLKVMGLAEAVKHKGTIVARPDVMANLDRVLLPQILDEETLKDIFETRLVLEVGMADLLCARITDKNLEALDEIVADEPEDGPDIVFDRKFEVRFHGKLYEVAGNDTLQRFQSLLLPVFSYVHENGMLEQPSSDGCYVSHKELVRLLRDGTADAFRTGMREHLDNQFRRIL